MIRTLASLRPALLALLAAQVGTGLFADDDISNSGPLVRFVSGATSSLLTGWHKNFGQWLIIALVLLHVAAIVFYLVRKRQNLVGPMLSGDKARAVPITQAFCAPGETLVGWIAVGTPTRALSTAERKAADTVWSHWGR